MGGGSQDRVEGSNAKILPVPPTSRDQRIPYIATATCLLFTWLPEIFVHVFPRMPRDEQNSKFSPQILSLELNVMSPSFRIAVALTATLCCAIVLLLHESWLKGHWSDVTEDDSPPSDCMEEDDAKTSLGLPQSQTSPCGLGFELTAFYGTAAISYPNGTTTPLTELNATYSYHNALIHLSLPASQHPVPPYTSYADEIADQPRQQARRAAHAAGLPASPDVRGLSDLLSALYEKVITTDDNNNQRNQQCVITISAPNLLALYEEDISDTLTYLRLLPQVARIPTFHTLLPATLAAYAGHGLGLCANYTDPVGCAKEQRGMPTEDIMAITYTADVLFVSVARVHSVTWLWEPSYRRTESWDLGSAQRETREVYWDEVAGMVRGVLRAHPYYTRPGKVILMGESAGDARFQEVLGDVLRSEIGGDGLPVWGERAETVVARGAGEIAKRSEYDRRSMHGMQGEVEVEAWEGEYEQWRKEMQRQDSISDEMALAGEL